MAGQNKSGAWRHGESELLTAVVAVRNVNIERCLQLHVLLPPARHHNMAIIDARGGPFARR